LVFQRILRGIGGIPRDLAEHILTVDGIVSNWLRNTTTPPHPSEWAGRLTEDELRWHLNRFGDHYPPTQSSYSHLTPFISTTAGVYERDPYTADILPFDPLRTAIDFATDGFVRDGFVFFGYVVILDRPSLPHAAFSEEIRSLTNFPWFLPFHHEGEVTAKIHIPSIQLEKWEWYAPAYDGFRLAETLSNPRFRSPHEIANVRELAAVLTAV